MSNYTGIYKHIHYIDIWAYTSIHNTSVHGYTYKYMNVVTIQYTNTYTNAIHTNTSMNLSIYAQ